MNTFVRFGGGQKLVVNNELICQDFSIGGKSYGK